MKRFVFFLLGFAAIAALLIVTARAGNPARGADNQIGFDQGTLATNPGLITAMTFGPDGRLYLAGGSGIVALTLDESGQHVVAQETISPALPYALGLAFDPTAPASTMKLYVSNWGTANNVFPGTISRFTSPDWKREDVITGLPEGHIYWHYTDGIAFDRSGKLYIGQGSTTEEGVGEDTPLGGAILVADVNSPSFDGHVVYDPPGVVANNVDQVAGDVHVFAPGMRNPYGIIVHSNGHIYATDNGYGGTAPSTSCTEVSTSHRTSGLDELDLIEQARYYGIPNRNRGRSDPRQCVYHAPDEPSTADYTAALTTECRLCESLAEYTGDAFHGAMKGDLVLTKLWSDGVYRVHLSADGRTALSTSLLAPLPYGALGIAVGPTGIIYVGTASNNSIMYLLPASGSVTPPPSPPSSPAPSSTPTPTSTRTRAGDVNCDGKTTSLDATLILQLSAGLLRALACPQNGDLNHDGLVDSRDALLVQQCSAFLLDCPNRQS